VLGKDDFTADQTATIKSFIRVGIEQALAEQTGIAPKSFLPQKIRPVDLTSEQVTSGSVIGYDGSNELVTFGPYGSPVGAVVGWVHGTPPTGWLLCDGSTVSRTTYADLFSVCSTTYGAGDGSTTFALPDLRGRVLVGNDAMDNSVGTGGGDAGRLSLSNTYGTSAGSQTVALTLAELARHNHEVGSHTHVDTFAVSISGNGATAQTATGTGSSRNTTAHTHTATMSGSVSAKAAFNTGESQNIADGAAHENMQPSLIMAWIIKT